MGHVHVTRVDERVSVNYVLQELRDNYIAI